MMDASKCGKTAWRVLLAAIVLFSMAPVLRAQDLVFRGDSVFCDVGSEVTVEFRTDNFWQITQGSGTLQWDPHVVDYVSTGDFGIPEISSGSFTHIPEGMLSFQWTASDLLGTTVPNGTLLFSVRFGVRGNVGDSIQVDFTDASLPLNFQSPESINLPFSTIPGNITVVPEPASAVVLAAGLLLLVGWRVRSRKARRGAGPRCAKR